MTRKKEKFATQKDGRKRTKIRATVGEVTKDIWITARTDSELEEKAAEIRRQLRIGEYRFPSDVTVREFAEQWLKSKAMKRHNTVAMYQNAIRAHIAPAIGNVKLTNLNRGLCQQMIVQRWGHPKTCRVVASTMMQIQASALADGILAKPFWAKIELPALPKSHKHRALTHEEETAVLAAELPAHEKFFLYALFGCGLRREEALALKRSDVDLENHTLRVCRVLTFSGNKPVIEETAKTSNSLRTVPIPDIVFDFVCEYCKPLDDDCFLVHMKNGELVTHSGCRRLWERIRKAISKRLGYDTDILAHDLRHNYCTKLWYSDVTALGAARLMGHADATMVTRIYAHLDEEREQMAAKVNQAFKSCQES